MKITITADEAEQRYDRFLRKYFKPYPEIKLADIFARMRTGLIKVNGKKTPENYRLQEGDVIVYDERVMVEKHPSSALVSKETKKNTYPLEKITSMLLYEDDNWLVRNKPADMVVHPGNKHTTDMTLHDILHAYLTQTDQQPDSTTFTPSYCFRLDKDTSGVIIAAKTYDALKYLNKLIRERQTYKEYATRVVGTPPTYLDMQAPLFKGYAQRTGKGHTFVNHAKWLEARTEAHLMETIEHPEIGPMSRLRIVLHTGRMHQIRVHLADAGYPVLGDLTYGHPKTNRLLQKHLGITRQMLHCHQYEFFDPYLQKTHTFIAPLPDLFFISAVVQ